MEATELATAQKVILGTSITFAVVIGALLPVAMRLVKLGPENYLPAAIFLVFLIVRNQRMVPLALLERRHAASRPSAPWKPPKALSIRSCWSHWHFFIKDLVLCRRHGMP